jgi:hypothetical protein
LHHLVFSTIALHNAKGQQPAASSNSSSNPKAITITVNNADEVISESYNTISNGSNQSMDCY